METQIVTAVTLHDESAGTSEKANGDTALLARIPETVDGRIEAHEGIAVFHTITSVRDDYTT